MVLTDLQCRAHALVGVRRRQPDVDDRHVGGQRAHTGHQVLGVVGRGNHLEPGVLENPSDALPDQDAVLCDRYLHGISALSRVPAPTAESTRRAPPSASTRSARLNSPVPPSTSAPPTPSSATSTSSTPCLYATCTSALVAWACLPMFARVSLTT